MSRIARLLVAASWLFSLPGVNPALGQELPNLPTQDLARWAQTIPGSQLQEITVATQFGGGEAIRPFANQLVVGIGLSGLVQFTSSRGMVRVVAMDDAQHEYLVYETYSLIAGASELQIENACRETCVLPPIIPISLKVELADASLFIRSLVTNRPAVSAGPQAAAQLTTPQQVKDAQEQEIVDTLNRQLQARGLQWIAGETEVSRLSYAEKKQLLACAAPDPDAPPPNLQGFEYYTGGIFTVLPASATTTEPGAGSSSLVPEFDWRSQHGANRPGSPYFDGDLTGSGWMTSVKNQRCADCWAHSALGATEALANLYFNLHVNVDLSEQELVSCSGAGSCIYGGNTGAALSYVQRVGVADEACFPESGLDEPCGNCCTLPQDRIRLATYESIYPLDGNDKIEREDNIKRRLIAAGPLPFGIASWWHALVLVGYDTDPASGEPVWILKNSWGTGWGEHGYGRVIAPLTDLYLIYELHAPVTSLVTPYPVACRDADHDGYFNWGIGADSAIVCGPVNPIEDCDDSDPTLAIRTSAGACTAALPSDITPPVITTTATPSMLWPPNGKMVPVTVSGTITDRESGVSTAGAVFTVTDDGNLQPCGDIDVGADGTYTFTVLLEASRSGRAKDGRTYIITVTAHDVAGNSGSTPAVVHVPHDMSRKD